MWKYNRGAAVKKGIAQVCSPFGRRGIRRVYMVTEA
jgi:hypothetical protein